MSNFWSSLFGGSNSNLSTDIGATGALAGNLTGQGEKNQNTAGNFSDAIVSGDATRQAGALAPEISAEKVANQQSQKTATEMGTRSGGTAAANAASSDKVHSDITNLIGSLINSSASNLASLGTSQVSEGQEAYNQNEQFSQQQMANWASSIFGKGITSAAAAGESYLLGNPGGSVSSIWSGKSGDGGASGTMAPSYGSGSGVASGITWKGGGTADADPNALFGTDWGS